MKESLPFDGRVQKTERTAKWSPYRDALDLQLIVGKKTKTARDRQMFNQWREWRNDDGMLDSRQWDACQVGMMAIGVSVAVPNPYGILSLISGSSRLGQ